MKLRICLKSAQAFDPVAYQAEGIGVEIQSFVMPAENPEWTLRLVEQWKEKLDGFRGPVATHGPFADLRPVSLDAGIAALSRQRYLDHLKIAHSLGAEYAVFHSQIMPTTPDRTQTLINGASGRFWKDLLEESEFAGDIYIENVFETQPEPLRKYIRSVNHPRIHLLLDIGHQKLSRQPLADWLQVLGPYIRVLHVHDNNRLIDLHEKPGESVRLQVLDYIRENPVDLSLEYPVQSPEEARKDWTL